MYYPGEKLDLAVRSTGRYFLIFPRKEEFSESLVRGREAERSDILRAGAGRVGSE